jgi:very-short-patch-repair endonuclease
MAGDKILVNFVQGPNYAADVGTYAKQAKESATQAAQSAEKHLIAKLLHKKRLNRQARVKPKLLKARPMQ